MTRQGFTLIEWLIYFFLITTVLTGMFHFVAIVHQQLIDLSKQSSTYSQLCAVQDALSRDLSMAPQNFNLWESLGPHSLAWKQGEIQCCWAVESGAFVRKEKQFDTVKKIWKSKGKSVVMRGDIEFNTRPIKGNKNSCVQGIKFTLSCARLKSKVSLCRTVVLKNGVLL